MKILEVKNVSKKIGDKEILKNISFEVEAGETLVILGKSGSGKSTLLRCINNLEKISCGNIIINGKEMVKEYKNNNPVYNEKDILKQINWETGMIFQEFNLFPHLSVKQNVTEALIYILNKNKNEANLCAERILTQMDLIDKKDEYPCNLSGGQKQRLSIARSLALDPKIICMDEPTSALDPELVGEVLKVIKKLAKQKKTMIIVTHEIKFAEEIASRIIFMDSGSIVEQGVGKELIRNPQNNRTKQFLKRYIEFEPKENLIKEEILDENKLEKEFKKSEIKEVLRYFKKISDIPRMSGKEEKIRDFLIDFAEKRNLEYYTDKKFNIVIRRNGNKEKREFLGFQAHTDMICEKEKNIKHDFLKEPLKLIQSGDFIKADGTTLGADNGIGVAMILAIFDSKKFENYNLEGIFTVQEETTMDGAKEIDVKKIKSKKIISLDNSKEGEMIVGSANCMEWYGKIFKEYEENNYENTYELEYSDFFGGHSGNDIKDNTRINPIKIGISMLAELENVKIVEIIGGSRVNVIPRNFKVVFSSPEDIYELLKRKVRKQKEYVKEYGRIVLRKTEKTNKVLSKKTTNQIIGFINSYINGAIETENDRVILSANLGAVSETDEYVRMEYSMRSNNQKLKDEYLKELKKLQDENEIEIEWEQELAGFEPDYDSKLIGNLSDIYKKMFDKKLEKSIVQGVLEGGILENRIRELEYVCIGPNIYDAHSPKEKISIKSIEKTWKFLEKIIEEL